MNNNEKTLTDYYINILPGLQLKEATDLKAYVHARKAIEDGLNESSSWKDVIFQIVQASNPTSQEALIDVIEHQCKTKVENVDQILNIIGIDISQERNKLISFLDTCILSNRENKLFDLLYGALKSGSKYNDILKYKLSDYGLPESWINWNGDKTDISDLINMAIYYALDLGKKWYSESDLKAQSEKIEAPLSVILAAENYYSIHNHK
jgi:hypothetical protein